MMNDLFLTLVTLKNCGWVFCLFFAVSCVYAQGNKAPVFVAEPKPNIVFILADDLGYGDLSCFGQKKFTTPSIDRLATEGMTFTQFYAGSTVCAPSRCSLMTGLHTGHSFIRGNKNDPVWGNWPLAADQTTVATLLKNAGYATGCFGKWGLGTHVNEGSPLQHGFDEFFGYYDQQDAHNYYPPFLHRNDVKIELDGKTYSHDLIEKASLDFIRKNKNKTFFCYLPVTIPHAAMQVPEEYVVPWRKLFPEFEDVIGKYSFDTEVRNPVAAFPGMLNRLDETVARILDLLKELGLDNDTIILFSSDNGPHQEGGHRSDFFQSNGPLKGIKRDLYEGRIRVPTLIRWPNKIKPGSVSDHPGAFWDVLPTLADIAGIPESQRPQPIDGLSFLPTLVDDAAAQRQHPYLYWEFYEMNGKIAARFGKWKGIRQNAIRQPNGPIEVYDLENDLAETTNIADKHPDIVEKFKEIFRMAHSPSSVFTGID